MLPLAGALLLAAIAGALLTVAAGPARIGPLRQMMRGGLHKAGVDHYCGPLRNGTNPDMKEEAP